MWRMHGDRGRSGGLFLPDSRVVDRQPRRSHDRKSRHGRPSRSAAKVVHRASSRAVRLLHRRHDHARAGAARPQSAADRARTARAYGAEPVPLRNPYAYPRRDPRSRAPARARRCAHPASRRGEPRRHAMSVKEDDINEGRRRFMMSGALMVSFSLFPGVKAMAQEVIADEGAAVHIAKSTEALAGSLKTNPFLDAWIKIDPAGKVT